MCNSSRSEAKSSGLRRVCWASLAWIAGRRLRGLYLASVASVGPLCGLHYTGILLGPLADRSEACHRQPPAIRRVCFVRASRMPVLVFLRQRLASRTYKGYVLGSHGGLRRVSAGFLLGLRWSSFWQTALSAVPGLSGVRGPSDGSS